MLQFKVFDLSVAGVVWRFYLMMAVVVVFGYLNLWALAAILAFIVAVSFIVGTSVKKVEPKKSSFIQTKVKLSLVDKKSMRKAA